MESEPVIQFVVDTTVVFEGLTKRGQASGLLIDAWYAGLFEAYVTITLAYEYSDVLSRKLSPSRWQRVQPARQKLHSLSHLITPYFSWRPIFPDVGDDHITDCAMNAGAAVVTANTRDFRSANATLGLAVLTPLDAVMLLVHKEPGHSNE